MDDLSYPVKKTSEPEFNQSPSDDVLVFPASFAQQRLWFLDKLQPGQSTYNVPFAIRLRGSLRVEALERSLRELIARHEVLRTTFSEDEAGKPIQVVAASQGVALELTDLRDISSDVREEEARRRVIACARLAFDLHRGPLFRTHLLRMADDDHVLSLVLHHSIVDGWSWSVLLRELSALYEAYVDDKPSSLVELPIQYGDYAVWQHDWLKGERLEELLGYWKERLEGAPSVLEIPTDFPRPPVQTFMGAQESTVIPATLEKSLQELSQKEGVTLFMTLLAAFTVLLARWSGQEDIVVGSPISGRTRAELEGLIGFFVNTLALRTDLSGNPSFRELLVRVRETALQAYAHQDLPFERLVEELRPVRDLSRSPVIQALFIFENAPGKEKRRIANMTIAPFRGAEGMTAKFDLTFNALVKPEGLRLGLTYNVDLFERSTAQRMLTHLHTLLEGMAAAPDRPIFELPLLSRAERERLLVDFNATATPYPRDLCVHELFERQTQRTPDSVAVIWREQQLSYSQLNEKSNQLAHYLRARGIGRGSLVAICMERSIEMVSGVLATLKAGAAYVPLDPEYPRDRLEFMLQDSHAVILLTQERLRDQFATVSIDLICVDLAPPEVSSQSRQNTVNLATPEDLAYVIYTSGSTGYPKGVCLPHRSLSNLLFWQVENSRAAMGTRTLQFTSLSFDVSFQEIFSTWCSGGTLVLVPESVRRDAAALWNFVRENQVARLFLPFVALQQLAEEAEEMQNLPTSLIEVITAGEQLQITPQLANLFSRLRSCTLTNHYGPSETHVVTSFHLTGSPDTWDALPPIGKPIANSEIYILDAYLNPVPLGVSGELCIGGISLANGYLNRPELTEERFIANPFSSNHGARLYRTGDLCRYLPNANIQYLGRIDNQVKVRGYRIELGEVESALAKHASVQHAVAVVREDSPGDKRLVAYVVPASQDISSIELRAQLGKSLPEYMIPSAFVRIERLPLTPSGKVNRRALPPPQWDNEQSPSDVLASRTPVEELLFGFWTEVLRRKNFGSHENFFDLGGHSLLATQVVSRIRRALQVDLPLRAIFEKPTIAELAHFISEMRNGPVASDTIALVRQPRKIEKNAQGEDVAVFPMSFAEQRLWILERLEPNTSVYNISIGLRLKGRLNVRALELSLEEVQRRHEVLRARFRLRRGEPEQCIGSAPPVSLPVVDTSGEEDSEAKTIEFVRRESRRQFDLAYDAPLRSTLLKLSTDDHVLLVTAHHIVFDGWSRGVLVRELSTLYQAYAEGRSSPLPDLAIQYTDFAVWQRQHLSGERLDREVRYWKQKLADAPSHLDLPTDRQRQPKQTFNGAHLSGVISADLTENLRQLSRKSGTTMFMTLLSAFSVLLARYSGQDDIVVGSPIAGRNRGECEKLIGFFVNTLALRAKLSGNPTFRELLSSIRETTLDAYAHQDLPFEKLVEEIKPERDFSRNPIFQVMFALQNVPDEAIDLMGLKITPFRAGHAVNAKFDLSLFLVEHADTVSATFEFNTDLFDATTIQRMQEHWQTLLQGIALNPDSPIAQLPLLSDFERHQLLLEGNNTNANFSRDITLHQLIEAQIERTPDATALVDGTSRLTYRELNSRANQLARRLRQFGVGPDVLVGVCMERGLDMVVALLAVLKAGGAYVPLDPVYPKTRLANILEDSRARVLITQHRISHVLPTHLAEVIYLDTPWPAVTAAPDLNLDVHVDARNLAYVLFTSGSTGRPKGVALEHRGAAVFLQWAQTVFTTEELDGTLFSTSICFDLSVFELFVPLSVGGKVIIVQNALSLRDLAV
ncbi:MAG: amino acid adenylation domain-containing protein, partial [Acidobacteriota bacterium]|nr:amino acid adenylation domain-containing protein [Acidobacteriota bacterium]